MDGDCFVDPKLQLRWVLEFLKMVSLREDSGDAENVVEGEFIDSGARGVGGEVVRCGPEASRVDDALARIRACRDCRLPPHLE